MPNQRQSHQQTPRRINRPRHPDRSRANPRRPSNNNSAFSFPITTIWLTISGVSSRTRRVAARECRLTGGTWWATGEWTRRWWIVKWWVVWCLSTPRAFIEPRLYLIRTITIRRRRRTATTWTWWTTARRTITGTTASGSVRTRAITRTAATKATARSSSRTALRESAGASSECRASLRRRSGKTTTTINRWTRIRTNRTRTVTITTRTAACRPVTTTTMASRTRRPSEDSASAISSSNHSSLVPGTSTRRQFSSSPRRPTTATLIRTPTRSTRWWSRWTTRSPSACRSATSRSGPTRHRTSQFVSIATGWWAGHVI